MFSLQVFLIKGVGSAFLRSPILILIGQYFSKRRGLANAVVISANSLGGLVFPPIYSYILYNNGLFGGMVVTSGILLHLFIGAALLRPPSFYKRNMYLKANKTPNGTISAKSAKSPKLTTNGNMQRTLLESSNSNRNLHENLAEITTKPFEVLNELDDKASSSLPMLAVKSPRLLRSEKRHRSASESHVIKRCGNSQSENNKRFIEKISDSNLIRYMSNADFTSQSFESLDSMVELQSGPVIQKSLLCPINTELCYFDTSLFKHFPYILCVAGYCTGCITMTIGYIFIPSFAAEQDIEAEKFPILVSIFGAADFIGRLLSGFLADRKWIKKQYIVVISQGIVCVTMNLARFCTELWIFVIFSGMLGLFGGMITALNPTIIMDVTGTKRFPSGIAIFALVTGISAGVTAPILGSLRDYTGTYYMTFHYIGIAAFTAMLIYTALAFVKADVDHNTSQEMEV